MLDQVEKSVEDAVLHRVSVSRSLLQKAIPFLGYLTMKLKLVITRSVPLAAVSQDRRLFLNPDWATTTTDAELLATLMHEVLHPALLMFERGENRLARVRTKNGTMRLFPIAHDYVVNQLVAEMTISSPFKDIFLHPRQWDPPGLFDEKYENWSVEEIYDHLLKESEDQKEYEDSYNDVMFGGPGEQGEQGSGNGKEESHFWKQAMVEAAMAHEATKAAGKLPMSLKKMLEGIESPKVSWVDVLSRWVGENGKRADFSYRRPSRRAESAGSILSANINHGTVDDIVVLWDTSGSMNGRETEILSEVIGICRDMSMKLRVVCCDCAIHSDQSDVESPEDVDVLGGGGSNFVPGFDLLTEEGFEGVVVAFTDGAIEVPAAKPPHIRDCLWILWEGERDPTDGRWGEPVFITADGYVA